MMAFLRDETGLCSGHIPPKLRKYGLLLVIANEVRGVIAVWPIAQAWFF